MTEVLFYHLERATIENVLPTLLEKSLERGWRVVVEVGSTERAEALDQSLWTYRDDSFLPHGLSGDETDPMQPILLTTGSGNANDANIRFFVDGAVPREAGEYDRLVYVFNGHDPDAVETARGAWKALREGNEVSYWQQDPNGRWTKKG